MKWQLILLITLLPLCVAAAYDMCEDKREINSNCTMLTPVLSCSSYTYKIVNTTGETVTSGTMEALSDGVYQFNLTEPEGDYIIILCDNTTREIRVTDEDDNKMILAFIILLPLFLSIIFLVLAATLGNDHPALRIFLGLGSIVPMFTAFHYAAISVAQYYNFTQLIDAIGDTVYWISILFMVLVTYFILYLVWKAFAAMAQNKKERMEY